MNERSEAGHWEGDLIIGARNRSAVLTMIERVSGYALLVDLPEGYCADAVAGAFVEAFESMPANLRRSLTLDQGSEWAQWPSVAATYGLDVWFCDPHSPWQRGAIRARRGSGFRGAIDTRKSGEPAVLGVIAGTGFGYVRPDGIAVIPVGALAP